MGLGWHALCKGQLHGDEHRLFVVLENQSEDVCHLAITAGLAQHVILQLPEGSWSFCEGRAIPKRPGLALNDSQIMSPVVDRPRWQVVAAFDDPRMLAQDVALRRHDQPVGMDPQADRSVRKGCRNAVAIALEADQAGGRPSSAMPR